MNDMSGNRNQEHLVCTTSGHLMLDLGLEQRVGTYLVAAGRAFLVRKDYHRLRPEEEPTQVRSVCSSPGEWHLEYL